MYLFQKQADYILPGEKGVSVKIYEREKEDTIMEIYAITLDQRGCGSYAVIGCYERLMLGFAGLCCFGIFGFCPVIDSENKV